MAAQRETARRLLAGGRISADMAAWALKQTGHTEKQIEMKLTLPEADINGLHFNKQEVHAVFEKRADGWYHSRDILFMSARNTEDDNSRDILMEYLLQYDGEDCPAVRGQFAKQIVIVSPEDYLYVSQGVVEISLPKENQGIKKYNGVDCWYWLADRYSGSAASFCAAGSNGSTGYNYASAMGGAAPMFRVR
jgi:hypothetical protein